MVYQKNSRLFSIQSDSITLHLGMLNQFVFCVFLFRKTLCWSLVCSQLSTMSSDFANCQTYPQIQFVCHDWCEYMIVEREYQDPYLLLRFVDHIVYMLLTNGEKWKKLSVDSIFCGCVHYTSRTRPVVGHGTPKHSFFILIRHDAKYCHRPQDQIKVKTLARHGWK